MHIQSLELGEPLVCGDELEAGAYREGREVGIHPELRRRGFAECEGFPGFIEIRRFRGELDARVGEESLKCVPRQGVAVRLVTVSFQYCGCSNKPDKTLLRGTAEVER